MASSTTSPIARTRPSSVSVLIVNPSAATTMKVAITETGTTTAGISVARKLRRKSCKTTSTRNSAKQSALTTPHMEASMNSARS